MKRNVVIATFFAAIFLVLLISTPAFAYAYMPVYYAFLVAPFTAWWAALLGLAVEWFCVAYFLNQSWARALGIVVFANIVSTFAVVVLILLLGVPAETFIRDLLSGIERSVVLYLIIAFGQIIILAVSTIIEAPIMFGCGVRRQLRSWMIIFAANFVSVSLLLWL
jgi:hypothetical protein